jgi:hypothetical protein
MPYRHFHPFVRVGNATYVYFGHTIPSAGILYVIHCFTYFPLIQYSTIKTKIVNWKLRSFRVKMMLKIEVDNWSKWSFGGRTLYWTRRVSVRCSSVVSVSCLLVFVTVKKEPSGGWVIGAEHTDFRVKLCCRWFLFIGRGVRG